MQAYRDASPMTYSEVGIRHNLIHRHDDPYDKLAGRSRCAVSSADGHRPLVIHVVATRHSERDRLCPRRS